MLRLTNFRVPITNDEPLAEVVARRLKLRPDDLGKIEITRQSLDARRKTNINYVYTLAIALQVPEKQILARLKNDKDVSVEQELRPEPINIGIKSLSDRPVVVGFGPAGMMSALMLAKYGYKPLVLERGREIEQRSKDVELFWRTGQFNSMSNVQFGEGGAGTFSDGKLTTRVQDVRMAEVLETFVAAGAPPEIKYLHKPHIGTDKLREVVKNIRKQIIAYGGEIEFGTQVTDVIIKDAKITGLVVNESKVIPCQLALFGIGHSARDTYLMLHRRCIAMEPKAFAVGVRIEHPQQLIDKAQYGVMAGIPQLGAADYALVYHDKQTMRTAYSFCMCPGGYVVAAASEQGGVVVNGMSHYARASAVANSALVVNVNPGDCGEGVLGGIEFQRHYERLAYMAGGEDYYAPVQSVGDFLLDKKGSSHFLTSPTYQPGTRTANLRECLPEFVVDTLAVAIGDFGKKIKGYDNQAAILTGIETRTSAPVRLLRNNQFLSINTEGLYLIGEGAGYAGGIMSAALDGINAAINIISTYRPC